MIRPEPTAFLVCTLLVLLAACATHPPPTPTATAAPTPTSTEPTTVRDPATRPRFMAHTMPWYQTPDVSGYWGWHWTMNYFDPAPRDDGTWELASHITPLTGPYDSQDPAILEYQTLLMKVSGIDGVIVDWYGIEDFYDYAAINEAAGALFEAAQRAGLQFAICYEDQTLGIMVDNDHFEPGEALAHGQDVMRYLASTWFGTDAYLTTEGQPVLFTFGPQYFKQSSDWEDLFSILDISPALIALDGHAVSLALASFPWPPLHRSQNGVLSRTTLESYLTNFYDRAAEGDYLVAGAFPGFHDIYAEAGVGGSYGYLDPEDGDTFALTLDLALAQAPDVVQLITWNDYGEGTVIEPTVEFEYRYLEILQAARRAADPNFAFTTDDLRLPLELYQRRQANPDDANLNTALDDIATALIADDPAAARIRLADLP